MLLWTSVRHKYLTFKVCRRNQPIIGVTNYRTFRRTSDQASLSLVSHFSIDLFSPDKQLLHQLVPLGVFFFRFFSYALRLRKNSKNPTRIDTFQFRTAWQ